MISAPYQNNGNDLVLSMIPATARRILDIGCGAGDNARRLHSTNTKIEIVGITHSHVEADMAAPFMTAVKVMDIEVDRVDGFGEAFDLLLLSHVLEHVRDPVAVVNRFLPLLKASGHVLIAVPNTLEWRTRLAFMRGRFKYADHGILDRTHLRFFTYETAAPEMIAPIPELSLVRRDARGAAPLGPLRHYLLPRSAKAQIDRMAVRAFPNLFAGEVALLAVKQDKPAIA
jgi:SAM-dependent methyltransferase